MALTNSQYDTIMRIYEQKRLRTHDLLTRRYNEIYEQIPRIHEIDNEISHLGVANARALIDGNTDAPAQFRRQLHALTVEKEALLLASGYPADYLEPDYECPDCQDTGYVDGRKCRCFQKAEIDLLYTQSNLTDILKSENFSTFRMDYYSSDYIDAVSHKSSLDMAKEAFTVCRSFSDHFGSEFQNLLIYGSTGVGKTFLTNFVARELLNTSHTVIYLTAFHLVDILQNNTFGNDDMDDSDENMFHYILDCDLLIIDDLGTELNNAFVTSQLFLCINERLLARKSTIISTNLSLDELQNEYSERIFSRLISNYEIMLILGDDIRIKKAISD